MTSENNQPTPQFVISNDDAIDAALEDNSVSSCHHGSINNLFFYLDTKSN